MFCLSVNNLVSLPLYSVIYKQLSKKPLVSVTLIDLISRDLIVYVYLQCLAMAVGVIHCLVEFENGVALNYIYSTLYASIFEIMVFCISISLILSGGLRLITLIKKSESAGHQLLGPENIAIVKIRVISVLLSVAYESFLVFFLDAHGGIFKLLHHFERESILSDLHSDHKKTLFMILPASALLVNLITKLYSIWIRREMAHTVDIFTIHNEGQQTHYLSSEELFSVSLGAAIGVPLWMLIAIASSFATREWQLMFFIPLQLFLVNLLFPIYVISKNNKMRNTLLGPLQEKCITWFTSIKRQLTNSVGP
jgi:hypothetical protein